MKALKVLLPTLLILSACTSRDDPETVNEVDDIDGVWRLTKSEIILPDDSRRPGHVQESFLIVAGGYYSMNLAGGQAAAPLFATQFAPTDAEKIARFSSLLVNAGRFEVSDTTIKIYPEFALMPEYVGGYGEFDYELNGDTLELEWRIIESVDGTPDPNTAVGVRFHYTWVRR